jgi:hypothetical protein
VNIYGSIEAFVQAHDHGREGNPVLNPLAALEGREPKVLLTAYWGFTPEDHPCLTFTDKGRLQTVFEESWPGFLALIYSSNTRDVAEEIRGRVVGLYQLSHQIGETEQFLSPAGLKRRREVQKSPQAWRFAFRAIRAWSIAPDMAPLISDFADESYSPARGTAISRYGTWLTAREAQRILDLALVPRPLFGGDFTPEIVLDEGRYALRPSRPGPVSQSAFTVREAEGPKHLYMLELAGNADHFLGEPAGSKRIIKVGFSKSPAVRRDDHNRTLPEGKFKWQVLRSTLEEGMSPYPSSDHAKAGEQEMIRWLIQSGKSLGGEFFLADDSAIEAAWRRGKDVAKRDVL